MADQEKKNIFAMTDRTDEFERDDINKNRVFAIFAYIGWLVLIPIFAAKNSKFARFHANQGLVLAIIMTASIFVLTLLSYIPYIGWLFSVLDWIASRGITALMVIGIITAATGKAKELPLIGKIKILK